MFLALQFNPDIAAAIFAETFKQVDLGVTASFDGFLVDHITIESGGTFTQDSSTFVDVTIPGFESHPIPTHNVLYNQPITVYLVLQSDLAAAGTAASTYLPLPLTVTFDVSFDVSGSITYLTLTYASVSSSSNDPRIAELEETLGANLPPQSSALDLVGLLSGLGVSYTPIQAGVALLNDGSVIEFRVEANAGQSSDNFLAWESFFAEGPDQNLLNSNDWALWLSVDGLIDNLQPLLVSGLTGSGFRLDSSVDIAWQPGTPPKLVVTFNGDVLNACTCFFAEIDVNVDVTVTLTFSIDQGKIRYDLHADHDANNLELLCCEVTSALLWPSIGAGLLYGGKIKLWQYLGGVLGGPAVVFIAALHFASTYSPSIPTSQLKGQCTQDGDSDAHCEVSLPVVTPASPCAPALTESRIPTGIYGIAASPLLPGLMILTGSDKIRVATQPTLTCTFDDFAWSFPTPTCSGTEGQLSLLGQITLQSDGTLPLIFTAAQVVGDNAAAYQPYLQVTFSYCPMIVTVTVDVPAAAVSGPCQVLVQTTAGVRILTLTPPPPLTQAQIDTANQDATRWRLDHCYTLLDPWYNYFHRFRPLWLVDPPDYSVDPLREFHFWDFAVANAVPGDQIALFDREGELLSTTTVAANGSARINTLLAPPQLAAASGRGEIAVQRLRPTATSITDIASPGAGNAIRMGIKQVLLIEQTQIHLPSRALAVGLSFSGRNRALTVAWTGGIDIYDVTNAALPRLSSRRRMPLQGARRSGYGLLLVWNDQETFRFDSAGCHPTNDLPQGRSAQSALPASDPNSHLRRGLLAQIDRDRVRLAVLAGTRTL